MSVTILKDAEEQAEQDMLNKKASLALHRRTGSRHSSMKQCRGEAAHEKRTDTADNFLVIVSG
jgi:hypothetical protein